MSFLDNLENNLKNLESRDQADDSRDQRQRQNERDRALAAAPWAERLKKDPFTPALLSHATRLGHAGRIKVHMTWLGNILRLDAGPRRLELRPTPTGIRAVFLENNQELRSHPLDLASDPASLAAELISGPAQK